MEALAIVEGLDVIEDFPASLLVGVKVLAVDHLEFQSAPKTLHGGVVVAVASTTHGS
jgi:hypothetical protein